MRKVAISIVVVAFAASTAFGGIVTFDPISPTSVLSGESVQFRVGVAAESLASFDAADILAGSMDLQILSLEYSTAWDTKNPFPLPTPAVEGIYPSDLSFGGFVIPAISSHTDIGILTVGTTGLAASPTPYSFGVDSAFDGGFSKLTFGLENEPLLGSGAVTVVPEPATLALLALGGFAALRRRARR